MTGSTPLIFNTHALEEYEGLKTEDGKPLPMSLIKDYVFNLSSTKANLEKHINAKDYAPLERIYHSMKSSSALIGAEAAAVVAKKLEHAISDKTFDLIPILNSELLVVLEKTIEEIQNFIHSEQP